MLLLLMKLSFFFEDLEIFVRKYSENKHLIVAGLSGSFERKRFGNILDLIPLAEKVELESAICLMCGNEAYYTKRMDEDKSLVKVGGLNEYQPRCRSCFDK